MNNVTPVKNIRICGVHSVEFSNQMIDDIIRHQRGANLRSDQLEIARDETKKELCTIRLIEIEIKPPDAVIHWNVIAQPIANERRENWQAPYDEQRIDIANGRWAFFLHEFNQGSSLETELGSVAVPPTTPMPPRLSHIRYEPP